MAGAVLLAHPVQLGGASFCKSFRDVLAGSASGSGKIGYNLGAVNGVPALLISDEDMKVLAKPFALTLIGKFVLGRPSVGTIKKFIAIMKFGGHVKVDHHDDNNVVFRFSNDMDYARFFSRRFYSVFGVDMVVAKWSPFVDISEDIPIVPVWINFPKLRYQLFNKETLMYLGKLVGNPLCVDDSTAAWGNMSKARVLVEVDVTTELPERVWIGSVESGAYQSVVYENKPGFCGTCKVCSHDASSCPLGSGFRADNVVAENVSLPAGHQVDVVDGLSEEPSCPGSSPTHGIEAGEKTDTVFLDKDCEPSNNSVAELPQIQQEAPTIMPVVVSSGVGGVGGDGIQEEVPVVAQIQHEASIIVPLVVNTGSGGDGIQEEATVVEHDSLSSNPPSAIGKLFGYSPSPAPRPITRSFAKTGEGHLGEGDGCDDSPHENQVKMKTKGKKKHKFDARQVALDALFNPPPFYG